MAREKPPYIVRHGLDKENKEAGHRVSQSPSSGKERKKQPPFLMKKKLQSFQEASFHNSNSAPIFSFDAETNPKHVTSPTPFATYVSSNRSLVGSTIPLGSVSSGKGDGRAGWLEQSRVGNFSKGKNHGGISEHAGINKSKPYYDLGLVQSGRDASMATYLPSNSRK